MTRKQFSPLSVLDQGSRLRRITAADGEKAVELTGSKNPTGLLFIHVFEVVVDQVADSALQSLQVNRDGWDLNH